MDPRVGVATTSENGTTVSIERRGVYRSRRDSLASTTAFEASKRDQNLHVVVSLEDKKLWSYYPDYSPDGRYLAFSVSPEHHRGEDWDLAIMDLQKPGQFTRLTIGPGNDRVPDWRP